MRSTASLLLLLAVPAAAQQVAPAPTTYQRAIAAGYKAAMLCSGLFISRRSQREIEADELAGIYPEYDAIVPTLPVAIDRRRRSVQVAWSPTMPPRQAYWVAGRGCIGQPIGAVPIILPEEGEPPLLTGDVGRWPFGEDPVSGEPDAATTAVLDRAFDGSYGVGSKTIGVVIVRDGHLAAERYRSGFGPFTANRTWSVGKSIAGTLVGLATSAGTPPPTAPAALAAWSRPGDPRARITTDQLLRMASGLHSDTAGNRTDAIYFGGAAVDQDATQWPIEAAPGTRFRYANNDILLAVLGLRERLGEQRYDRLAPDFFRAIGMGHTVAERDWAGNYVLSSQVWSTARDLARLGQLWLQDGVWQGKRLLPEGWVRTMTTPTGPQPTSGPGYGATLWLFGPAQGLPEGSYAAQGNRGQYVMVIPSRRLVIVRRGEDPGAARFDVARFAADVVAVK